MHRCLQICEIIHIILDNMLPFPYCDLLSVALVSKSLHEPALDLLWSFQHSLLRLLKTFPQDIWTGEGLSGVLVS
jgi:hypothetical protein